MPSIVLWSWELGPDLSVTKARYAFREIVKGDPCSYCGEAGGLVDHIQPRGISYRDETIDEWTNLTGACVSCNSAKGARPLIDFLLGEPVNATLVRWMERNGRLYRRPTVEEMALWPRAA